VNATSIVMKNPKNGKLEEIRFKLFRFRDEKCGCCNWPVTIKYVIAISEEEAKKLLDKGEAGLCGDCLCDLLVDEGYTIIPPRR